MNDTYSIEIETTLVPELDEFMQRIEKSDSSIPKHVAMDTLEMIEKLKEELEDGLDKVYEFTTEMYAKSPTLESQQACMNKMKELSSSFPEFVIGVFASPTNNSQEFYATYYYRGEMETKRSVKKELLYNLKQIEMLCKHQFKLPKISNEK